MPTYYPVGGGRFLVDPLTGEPSDSTIPVEVTPEVVTTLAVARVTVDTTADQIFAASVTRKAGLIKNMDASITLYLGPDNTVTSSTGYPVLAGASFSILDFGILYTGAVFGVVDGGTITVAKAELSA
jgi:hypothetical protein